MFAATQKEGIQMVAMDALRRVMELTGVRPAVLCGRLNIESNVLSQRFKQKNVSVSKLNEMARMLDYKIVLVPRDAKIPDGGYEIE